MTDAREEALRLAREAGGFELHGGVALSDAALSYLIALARRDGE